MMKYFILVGFVQGVCLLLLDEIIRNEETWLTHPELIYPAYSLVVLIPMIGLLTYHLTTHSKLAKALLGAAFFFVVLTGYSGYLALPISSQTFPNIFVVGLSMWAFMFVGLPFLQSYFRHKKLRLPYEDLYEFGWLNTQVFILALMFVGLVWSLLSLWAALFELLHITLFSDLFFDRYFAYPATCIMVTYGAYLGLEKFNISTIQRTDFLFRAVTVLLSVMTILFLLALLVSGLEPLWGTRNATFLLLWLQVFTVLFVNGMFQHGYQGRKESSVVRWAVTLQLITLPMLSLICLYAMYLRVEQYGWTEDRVWAVLFIVLLATYAMGYFVAAVRGVLHKGEWLALVAPTNVIAALFILVLIILTHSPLLSPVKISVSSQIARLMEGEVKAADFDYRYLRFRSGQVGLDNLQVLSTIKNHAEADEIHRLSKEALKLEHARGEAQVVSFEESKTIFGVYPKGHETTEDMYQFLYTFKEEYPYRGCYYQQQKCNLLFIDLNNDGTEELVVFDSNRPFVLMEAKGRGWRHVADFRWGKPTLGRIEELLNKDGAEAIEHEWKQLKIGENIWGIEKFR